MQVLNGGGGAGVLGIDLMNTANQLLISSNNPLANVAGV